MKKLYLLFSLLAIAFTVRSQLFKQDFQSSTSIGAYVSVNPNNGQFNDLFDGDAGNNMLISINSSGGNNTLRFNKSGNAVGAFTRVKDFSPQPGVIVYTFDITVTAPISTVPETVATWYLGNNFSTGGTAPVITGATNQTYAYFFLDYIGLGNPDKARFKSSTGLISAPFDVGDKQTVFFIANNSGATVTYLAPNGVSSTVANDTYDLWVENVNPFNNVAVTGPAEAITDMKFIFQEGTGIIDLDNILVDEYSELGTPFYQNFNTSTDYTDYISFNPYNGSFKEIFDGQTGGANAANMVVSINTLGDTSLSFNKAVTGVGPSDANVGAFVRTTDIGGTPPTIMFEFDFQPGGTMTNLGNSAAKIYFGSTLPGGAAVPADGVIHSYIEVDLDAETPTNRFRFRKGGVADPNPSAADASVWFNVSPTPYRMLLVINNSTVAKEYYTPLGTIESLPVDEYVLWVGTTKAFSTNGVATTPTVPLQNVKFLFNNFTGDIQFDNMLIDMIPEPNVTTDAQIINNTTIPQFLAKWTASNPTLAVSGYRLDVATTPFSASTTYVPGFENLYVDGPVTLSKLVTGVSTANTHYYRVRPVYQIGVNEVSGTFSNVTILSSAIFLPVTLTSFTGNIVDKNGVLKWKTEEEINSAYYDVERSTDGQQFTAVGNVKSANSVTGSDYTFTDYTMAAGKNYYRLKMVDIDGKFEYSHVIVLNNSDGAARYGVYPNPAISSVMVQYNKAKPGAIMRLVDMEGRLLKMVNLTTGSTQVQLNVSTLKPGAYNLVIFNGEEQKILRIQKQ